MKIDLQRINFAVAPPPQFKEARGQEWYTYGQKNDFPAVILNLYNSSSLHNAIVTQKAHFIAGKDTDVIAEGTLSEQVGAKQSLNYANPYEFRHGLQYELEQGDDYSDEALEKAKTTVLKNLAKDANFYSTLLNQKQSHYEFKTPETDAPGM